MGIFSINMTVLYGKGRQTFYRLQVKITRRSVDTSLFLWGKHDLLTWYSDFALGLHGDPEVDGYDSELYHSDANSYLLASSSRDFVRTTTFACAHLTPSARIDPAVRFPLSPSLRFSSPSSRGGRS